jgi:hypothetical protein
MFGTHKRTFLLVIISSEGMNEWQTEEIQQYFLRPWAITAAPQMREEGEQP